MREVVFGNIVDLSRGFIVHGCNAQGAMNFGVAKAIRDKYPRKL
jgi:O-acetyl-ADP-ribose deacetylase (regulator of RNase III)